MGIWELFGLHNSAKIYELPEPLRKFLQEKCASSISDLRVIPFIFPVLSVIPYPARMSKMTPTSVPGVPHATFTSMAVIKGAGKTVEIEVVFKTVVVPSVTVFYVLGVFADGVDVHWVTNKKVTMSDVAISGGNAISEFFQAHDEGGMAVTRMFSWLPVSFKESLEVKVLQSTGVAVDCLCYVYTEQFP